MRYVIEKILSKFGDFKIEHNDRGNIHISGAENVRGVSFDMPVPRTLVDFKSFSVSVMGDAGAANENLWIHQVWHAMRVMFPALEELHLLRDLHLGRDLTIGEIASVGHCIWCEKAWALRLC